MPLPDIPVFDSDDGTDCHSRNSETAKFAASYAYTANLIFMTSGNKLYRIDLDRGRAIELYTYETDPSAQIVSLKFKDPESVREEGEIGRAHV